MPGRKSIHTAKFDRCVSRVKARGGRVNAYAVCQSSLGSKAIKKSHRRK